MWISSRQPNRRNFGPKLWFRGATNLPKHPFLPDLIVPFNNSQAGAENGLQCHQTPGETLVYLGIGGADRLGVFKTSGISESMKSSSNGKSSSSDRRVSQVIFADAMQSQNSVRLTEVLRRQKWVILVMVSLGLALAWLYWSRA